MDKVLGGSIRFSCGIYMPLIGFGTYDLSGSETIRRAVDCALGTGYRLIDTAHLYENEMDIGNSLKQFLPKYNLKRDDIFLTTKLICPAEEVQSGIDGSLSRLQTDYIDLVLLHYPMCMPWSEDAEKRKKSPDNKTWRKAAWLQLEKLTAEGKIRAIGVSTYEPNHLNEMSEYATVPVSVNQVELHPYHTRDAIVAKCKEMNIDVQAFTSMGRNNSDLVNEPILNRVAQNHQATVPQVLLAWAMQLGIGVLPKSAHPERIKSNFQAVLVKLEKKEIEEISKLNKDKPFTTCLAVDVA